LQKFWQIKMANGFQLLQDMRAMLPPNEAEGTLFQCLFLKKLPAQMSDAIMAANLEDVEAMADMADRLFDKPATPSVAAVSPCCQHVSAVDSKCSGRSPNSSGNSPDRRSATPGRRRGQGTGKNRTSFPQFCERNGPASMWTTGAKKNWCYARKYFGDRAKTCEPPCSYSEN
jgi:hypothetical protein